MLVLLFGIWLILNGKITAEICVFGVILAAALFAFMCRFMDYSLKKEICMYRLFPLFIQYFGVLIAEIVKANMAVLKLILSPGMQPEPEIIYFRTDLKSQLAKAMLANSITLTPGTITVSVEGDQFCVHCLDREMGEGMESSVFVDLLKRLEMEEKKWG